MALTRATDKIIANADGNLNLSGIVTAQNFTSGSVSISNGIVTATSFSGDGSGLEGVSSSGIGTALSDDDTSPLNKVYYVNQELSIGSTVTVNHPDSAVASYTHYQDLVVTDDADFIVADGDTFIPDVLGIRSSTSTVSAATGGRIRAGTITNAGANGAVNFPDGITVTGVVTATTFKGAVEGNVTGNLSGNLSGGTINATSGTITGNLGVGGVLTYEDVTNVDSVGLITARAGINVVGNDLNVGSNIKLGNASGIVTATSFSGDGSSLTGVSSPTANRNFIINGAMRFWQRGHTFNSQGNGQNDYTTDRFAIGHNNSHMAAVTRQSGTGAHAKFQYCSRIQRDSGNSQTDQMRFHTALETNDVILLRGEVLTLSYYARKGANYSEANSKITGVRIATGENTDGDPNAYSGGHWTNSTTILTGTPTLTTSWQRFSHTTSAVSNSANSMIIEFRNTPVGTAGANDYYEITGVQLEIGSTLTAFEHRRYSDELARCQRYFQIVSHASAMARSSSNTGAVWARFAVEMRTSPVIGTMHLGNFSKNVGLNLQGDNATNTTQSSYNISNQYNRPDAMYIYDLGNFSGMNAGRTYTIGVPANNSVAFIAKAEL